MNVYRQTKVTLDSYSTPVTAFEVELLGRVVVSGAISTSSVSLTCGISFGGNGIYSQGLALELSCGIVAVGSFSSIQEFSLTSKVAVVVDGHFEFPAGCTTICGVVIGCGAILRTRQNMDLSGGFVFAANILKTQMPYVLYSPAVLCFDLADVSTNFKLEQQP